MFVWGRNYVLGRRWISCTRSRLSGVEESSVWLGSINLPLGNFALGFSVNSAKVRAWACSPRVTALKWNGAVALLQPQAVADTVALSSIHLTATARCQPAARAASDERVSAPPNFTLIGSIGPASLRQTFQIAGGNRAAWNELRLVCSRSNSKTQAQSASPFPKATLHSVRCAHTHILFLQSQPKFAQPPLRKTHRCSSTISACNTTAI